LQGSAVIGAPMSGRSSNTHEWDWLTQTCIGQE
jgi:hypothetical protein